MIRSGSSFVPLLEKALAAAARTKQTVASDLSNALKAIEGFIQGNSWFIDVAVKASLLVGCRLLLAIVGGGRERTLAKRSASEASYFTVNVPMSRSVTSPVSPNTVTNVLPARLEWKVI